MWGERGAVGGERGAVGGGEGCSVGERGAVWGGGREGCTVVVGNAHTGMFLITHYSKLLSNHYMQNRLSLHTEVL